MRRSILLAALPATFLLAACTPPPDSPLRMTPTGERVQLTDPRTCLDRECLEWDSRRGRVSQPGRESFRLPAGMADADGFVSRADFQRLLDRSRAEPSIANGEGIDFTVTRGLGFQ
ncbi:MAG: hypothetical protein ACXIU8_09355 [Alkalilacustris sp.]